jgi:rare lipoprotein A
VRRLAPSSLLLCAALALGAEEGLASWYAGKFQGRKTASGEIFDTNQMTAAHKTLPFGTTVRVRNEENGRDVVVRINDRGPFVEGRIIDLSRAAAEAIAMTGSGVARVSVEIVDRPGAIRYTVQVAAFSRPENAARAVTRLASHGVSAVAERGPDGVHRVRVRDVAAADLARVRDAAARAGFARTLAAPGP